MKLQLDQFLTALQKLSDKYQNYHSPILTSADVESYTNWFLARNKEKLIETYEELFGFYDNDPATATDQLIPLLAMSSLSARSEILFQEDLRLQKEEQGIYLFDGNLKINGNLKYDGYVFVAGDLNVLGRIESLSDWPGLFVAGSIKTQAITQVIGAESDILISGDDILVIHMICSGNVQAHGRIESRLSITTSSFWKIGDQAQFQFRLEPDYRDWNGPLTPEALKVASQLSSEIIDPAPSGLAEFIERIEKAIDEKRAVWKDPPSSD